MEISASPAELHVDDPGGPDPVVVLLHGAMDRSTSLARTAGNLAGLRVLRYDRRGYGRSVGAGPADIDGHVQDLFDVLAGRRATVVGHSIGGVIALAAAARAPRQLLSAGAFEPPTPWVPWWHDSPSAGGAAAQHHDPGDAAEAFLRRMIGDDRWERLPSHYREQRRAEGVALITELRSIQGPEPPFDASTIAVPVLIGHGGDSSRRHVRVCAELVAAIPGASLHVVDAAGHDAHASQPAAYAEFVRLTMASAEGR